LSEESHPLTRGRLWLIQISVGVGVITSTADSGSVNVALYQLAQNFEVSTATASWLILVGFLTVTSSLLIFGRLSDMLGNKKVYNAGFLVFGLGATLCSLAPSFSLLLGARIIQTLGLSMLSANQSAILTECFPVHQRGTALGINSTLVGAGYFVGPILGGFVLQTFGWHYVFLSSVPLALIGFVTSMVVLPTGRVGGKQEIDISGAFAFALAATSMLLGLNQVKTDGWASLTVAGLLLTAVLMVLLFVYIEMRTRLPMVDLSLFSIRLFSFSLLSAFLHFLGSSVSDLVTPLYSQQVLRLGPGVAGVATATLPFVRMFLSSASGVLSDRVGTRNLATAGCLIVGVGFFGLSRLDANSDFLHLMAILVVVGVGSGTFFSPNMSATMGSVPRQRIGMASAALAARRNIGQSVGVAIAATLLPPVTGATVEQMAAAFQGAWVFAAFAVVGAAVVAALSGSTAIVRKEKPG
jgi:EmrB/QacA subfamily drug resistance transporter